MNGYGRLPLSFEVNEGQTDKQVKFFARGAGYGLFLTPAQAVLALKKFVRNNKGSFRANASANARRDAQDRTVLRMRLVGANRESQMTGIDELPGKSNYFIGNDPSKWRTNVTHYGRVQYKGIYAGVDLVCYGNQGQLEYDWIVAPHADYKQIKVKYKGAQSVHIDEATGDLILTMRDGFELRQQKPIIYQEIAGERRVVDGRYESKRNGPISAAVAPTRDWVSRLTLKATLTSQGTPVQPISLRRILFKRHVGATATHL